jgi:hypothetical protein
MSKKRTRKVPGDRIPVRLPPELSKQFRHVCVDLDISLQDAMIEGVKLWLAGRGKPLPKSPDTEGLSETDLICHHNFAQFLREAEGAQIVRNLIRDFIGPAMRGPEEQRALESNHRRGKG